MRLRGLLYLQVKGRLITLLTETDALVANTACTYTCTHEPLLVVEFLRAKKCEARNGVEATSSMASPYSG